MVVRAVAVWFVILALAFVNGGFRELVLVPRLGSLVGHQISVVLLCTAILAVTFFTGGWLRLPSAGAALGVGLVWLVLTLTFEFGAGHYLFHKPWDALLVDYRIFEGRLWLVVLAVTLLSPLAAFLTAGIDIPQG